MMDAFDTGELPFIPSPMPFSGNAMQHLDYMSVTSGLDLQDQYSNFDAENYMRLVLDRLAVTSLRSLTSYV